MMFSRYSEKDIYKWYKDDIVIFKNKKYLGKNDSLLFFDTFIKDLNEIPEGEFILKNNKFLLSLDFVCDFIRNNLTYDQLKSKFKTNPEDDIKGYPWVSFFTKLNEEQVEVILKIAKKENSTDLFKRIENLYERIKNNETIDCLKVLLAFNDSEIAAALKKGKNYDFNESIKFGKQCNILFEKDFIFGQREIDEFCFALKIFKEAQKGNITEYIDGNLNSIAAFLVFLRIIKLKQNSNNNGKSLFSKIDSEYVYNWIKNKKYLEDDKIDEFLKFMNHLKGNEDKYYLGSEIYNYIIEKLKEEYPEIFNTIIEYTSETNEDEKKHSSIFENKLMSVVDTIDDYYINKRVFSFARKGELVDYLNSSYSPKWLLKVLQIINLKPNLKTKDGKSCYEGITPKLIFDLIDKHSGNFYRSEAGEILEQLYADPDKYYLGKEIYYGVLENFVKSYFKDEWFEYIKEIIEEDGELFKSIENKDNFNYYFNASNFYFHILKYKGIIDDNWIIRTSDDASKIYISIKEDLMEKIKEYVASKGNFSIDEIKNEFKISDYLCNIIRNILLREKYIDEGNKVYSSLTLDKDDKPVKKDKDDDFIQRLLDKIKNYVVAQGYFSASEIMEKFNIDKDWCDIFCNRLKDEKVIDINNRSLISPSRTLDKKVEPAKKNDNMSSQDIVARFTSEFMTYASDIGVSKSEEFANKCMIEFIHKLSKEELSNPELISLLKTKTKCDPKLIELVVNIELFGSLNGMLQNTNIKYIPDDILDFLKLIEEYKFDLPRLDPTLLDNYFEKNGYYDNDDKEKIKYLYSFFYNLIYKLDKYQFKNELISYFTNKYNIYENFDKIKSRNYNIEHKLNNQSLDNNSEDNNDDDYKNNSGGGTSSTDDEPFIQKIEIDEGTEFEILEHSLPRNEEEKKDVFKTIMCGIGCISCVVLTAIEEKDLLSSVVECSKSFNSLISKNPILSEIKLKLGNNNLVPYFSEIVLGFKDLLQPKKVYVG